MGGGALAVYGLTRRSAWGVPVAAAGGALAYFGTNRSQNEHYNARTSVLVNARPEEAFRFWHNFEQLPLFMNHIDSVSSIGDGRYRWVALGPMGMRIRWDAEITQDSEPRVIAWRSLPASEIETSGEVRFEEALGKRGTVVTADIRYRPPARAAGNIIAKLFGKHPHFLIEQDLRRFKALIETGEIPTTEGQSHGPRSAVAAAARMVNPDRPVRFKDSEMREVFAANRRVS